MKQDFDILIIGSGPGGFAGAIEAAQLGLSVAIVEMAEIGGVCTNWGCIPTKSLLETSKLLEKIKKANRFGIEVPKNEVSFNLKKVVKRSRDVASKLSKGIQYLLTKNNVTVFQAQAKFLNQNTLSLSKFADNSQELPDKVTAKHIIIATGARQRDLPGLKPNYKNIITSKQALAPEELPKKLAVIGAGAIGVEFAYIYKALGVDVTIIEMLPHIIPVEDVEASELLHSEFKRKKIKVYTNTIVSNVIESDENITLNLKIASSDIEQDNKKIPEQIEVDQVLVAIGVLPNSDKLGLEVLNIEQERGFIKIEKDDASYRTNIEGIYAIGDVSGVPLLAHKATHEGLLCVNWIAHKEGKINQAPKPMNYDHIPAVTFTEPEIASIGLNAEKAVEHGYEITIGQFPYSANGRASASNESKGFVKLIFDKKTNKILGGTVAGYNAGEVLSAIVTPLNLNADLHTLKHLMYPHPTLSEMVTDAARISDGTDLL